MSGKTIDRPRYTVLKADVLREGDTLIIYELDRLARNKKAISEELRFYENHGIRVMILDIPTTTIDLPEEADSMNKLITDTVNKVIIEIYAMQAESEMQRREKRQREGIEAKKARGSGKTTVVNVSCLPMNLPNTIFVLREMKLDHVLSCANLE